jgi:hypothetical protein
VGGVGRWVDGWVDGWVDHACLYGSISHEKTCSMRSAARPALSWLHASEIIWRARSGASVPEHLFDPTKGVAPRHALAHAHAHARTHRARARTLRLDCCSVVQTEPKHIRVRRPRRGERIRCVRQRTGRVRRACDSGAGRRRWPTDIVATLIGCCRAVAMARISSLRCTCTHTHARTHSRTQVDARAHAHATTMAQASPQTNDT